MPGPKIQGAAGLGLPIAAVLCAMACFQVGAALSKGLFPAVGPQGAAALRISLAAAMLLVIQRPWRTWPQRAPAAALAVLGLASAGAMMMFYLGLSRLPQGVTIGLQFLGPLAIALAGSRKATDLVWAALAAAGVWGLVGPNSGGGRLDPVGIGFALGAAASWAAYILSGRIVGRAFGNASAAWATSIAALVAAPIGIAHAGWALVSPAVLPLGLLVALVATALPFSLELYAMPRMPGRTFSVFMSLEPGFGALSGLILLHERLAWPQLAGLLAVISAAAGAAWSAGRRAGAASLVTEAPPD